MAKKINQPDSPIKKVQFAVWRPLLDSLSQYTEDACLRRDAFLSKAFSHEIALLRRSDFRNSDAAYQFIHKSLRELECKSATFNLPERLVADIEATCEARNIHKDCFFNRVLLLLVPFDQRALYDWLYDEQGLAGQLWSKLIENEDVTDYDDLMFSAIHAIKSRVEDDPLGLVRTVFTEHWGDEEPEYLDRDPLTRVIPPSKAMSIGGSAFDMVGFNVRLWDSLVPGTPSNDALKKVQLLL